MRHERLYIIFLGLYLFGLNGYCQTREQLEQEKKKAKATIEETSKILKSVTKTQRYTTNQVRVLSRQINSREKLLGQYYVEIKELNERINDNEFVIESLSRDVEEIKKEYSRILQYIYVRQPNFYEILFVFASDDFNQAFRRIKYIQQYTEYRKKQVHLIFQIQDLIERKKLELTKQKNEKEVVLASLNQEKRKLEQNRNQQKNLIGRLSKKQKALKNEIKKQERIARRLEEEIKDLIAAEAKKNAGVFKLTPEEKIVSENFEKNKGKLPWPVPNGIISETFGVHEHPVLKHIRTQNDGINITTTEGNMARAVFDGSVVKVIAIPGANQTVILKHGNYMTVYNNLENINVSVGEKVKIKQELGTVFTDKNKGNNTVLQFMIWQGVKKLNPENWLSK